MAARPPVELTIEGQGLAALQRKLKTLPNGRELTRELNKGLRAGAQPLPGEARDAARTDLPRSGGLAAEVASGKFGLRIQNGRTAGVTVYAKGSRGQVRDIRATDRGMLRHPLFGNRGTWVLQRINPGWFTNRMRREAPGVRPELLKVLNRVAAKVARS